MTIYIVVFGGIALIAAIALVVVAGSRHRAHKS